MGIFRQSLPITSREVMLKGGSGGNWVVDKPLFTTDRFWLRALIL